MTKWFSTVACDRTVADPYVADAGDIGVEDWELRQGKSVADWSPGWIRASTPDHDGEADDVLQSHLGLPIYSARLRAALRESGIEDIQYLPLRVLRSDGRGINGFSIANITTVRDALDRERSDYSTFGGDYVIARRRGDISDVRTSVLMARQLTGCDVFRLQGFLPAYYVSERFRDVFERHRFTGYSFRQTMLSEG